MRPYDEMSAWQPEETRTRRLCRFCRELFGCAAIMALLMVAMIVWGD